MTAGRIVAVLIVLVGLVGGVAMWWLQTRAYYEDLAAGDVEMTVVPADGGAPRPIAATDFAGIDSDSSPIRFRACFATDPEIGSDAARAPEAAPLNAPGWFGCFDAPAIGAALESGEATALLSRTNEPYGIDRIIALYPDGRGYAWTQINHCGEAVFDGEPAPEDCPPPPDEAS